MSTLGSLSHWRNHKLRGDLSACCCASLGKEQCGQHVAAPLTLLMESVLVSVFQGGSLASPPYSRILSVVSCS